MQPTQQDIQTLHGVIMAIAEGRKGPARGGVLDGAEAEMLRALLAEHGEGRVPSERGPVRGLARLLRRNPTEAERTLWQALVNDRRLANRGFKRQTPVGPHICDFVSFPLRAVIDLVPAHEEFAAAKARVSQQRPGSSNAATELSRLRRRSSKPTSRRRSAKSTKSLGDRVHCARSNFRRMRRCKKFPQIGNFDDAIGQYKNAVRRAPAGAALDNGDLRGGRLAARAVHRRFPERGRTRFSAFATHVALGEFVLVLLAVRLLWRFANRPPALLPTRFGRTGKVAATFGHYALYALLLAVPIVGIVAQLKRGNALPIFGVWHLVSPWPADRAAAHSAIEVHEVLANALLIFAALHASAALIHHYVFGDRTLVRMLPGRG